MTETWLLVAGVLACAIAIGAAFVALLGWRSNRLPVERRTLPGAAAPEGSLAAPSQRLSTALEKGLAGSGRTARLAVALDLAGMSIGPGDFLLLVLAGSLAAGALGLILFGLLAALLLTLVAPMVGMLILKFRTGRRRAAFADQLEDSLQLLAGSLRAGHSLLRAIDAAVHESESPTAEEFSRVTNQNRVGRPLDDSLGDTAQRMDSKDFAWVAQAIAIHRTVGGDLAEVLDTVGQTIRERNQIRRQVKALSAEGRMSAYVLVALPFVVAGLLVLTNPGYLTRLTESIVGWIMIGGAAVMLTIGALWLRKIVTFTF
jgi:tight adherence protein B